MDADVKALLEHFQIHGHPRDRMLLLLYQCGEPLDEGALRVLLGKVLGKRKEIRQPERSRKGARGSSLDARLKASLAQVHRMKGTPSHIRGTPAAQVKKKVREEGRESDPREVAQVAMRQARRMKKMGDPRVSKRVATARKLVHQYVRQKKAK